MKWFADSKGYGFITPDAAGTPDVFVHYSGISSRDSYKSLAEGARVEFDVVQGQKGPQAANVTVVA